MSWKASGYVKGLTHSPRTGLPITRAEKLVLLVLSDYHNEKDGFAHPSINRLAEECLYERRQVLRIVDTLEEKGFVEIERHPRDNNRYFIVGLVTKCHQDDATPGDISRGGAGDILPLKMSPEPIRTTIENHNIKPSPSQAQGGSDPTPTSKKVAEVDPRHQNFHATYERLYMEKNHCTRSEVPWGAREATWLKNKLKAMPGWSTEFLNKCLTNRFNSEVNHGEPLWLWREKLASYRNSALNAFNKPIKGAAQPGAGEAPNAMEAVRDQERKRKAPSAFLT